MKNGLTNRQSEIVRLFYSLPKRKVVYDKQARVELWKYATAKNHALDLDQIRTKCPALSHQIKKSYENEKNIQSAVFSECSYAQTLATMLSLPVFINCFDDQIVFSSFTKKMIADNHLTPRYIYTNAPRTEFLIQAGGCGGIDCIYVSDKDNVAYTIEFKEPGAKTSEPDLPKYGEEGNLIVTEEFLSNYPQFEEMLKDQSGLNFFSVMGNNVHDFRDESIDIAVSDNYSKKFAEVICTEDKDGYLVMIPANQVSIWAQLSGEIRPAGRNHYAVWTPKALNRFLREKNALIDGDSVTISIGALEERTERGGNGRVSGYKINPIFFVYVEDCVVDNDNVRFDINKVQQLNPTIAGKLFFNQLDYEVVKRYYCE